MTHEPSREQLESAKELSSKLFSPIGKDIAVVEIAAFLAARDAETIRPWAEAVRQADSVVKSEHHRFCWGGGRYVCADQDGRTCYDKWKDLTDSHPVPHKGESACAISAWPYRKEKRAATVGIILDA